MFAVFKRERFAMKIALCTIAFRDRPFEAVLDLAVRAGFDGVEPWGKPDHMPGVYDADYVRWASAAIRKRGLAVSQYGSYANPTSGAFAQEMEDALKIARDLGTDKIRIWAGQNGSAEAAEGEWETAISGFRTFSDRAGEQGATLAVEMHDGYLSDTARSCLRLLEGVDRPNFQLNFQPMYTHDPGRVLEELGKVAGHVTTVHAQNYTEAGSSGRSLIAEGFVDYAAVVAKLREAGFDGYLEVEFVREENPEEALRADAKFLRSLCEG